KLIKIWVGIFHPTHTHQISECTDIFITLPDLGRIIQFESAILIHTNRLFTRNIDAVRINGKVIFKRYLRCNIVRVTAIGQNPRSFYLSARIHIKHHSSMEMMEEQGSSLASSHHHNVFIRESARTQFLQRLLFGVIIPLQQFSCISSKSTLLILELQLSPLLTEIVSVQRFRLTRTRVNRSLRTRTTNELIRNQEHQRFCIPIISQEL